MATLLDRNESAVREATELLGIADGLLRKGRQLRDQVARSFDMMKDAREANWAALARLNETWLRACMGRKHGIPWDSDEITDQRRLHRYG